MKEKIKTLKQLLGKSVVGDGLILTFVKTVTLVASIVQTMILSRILSLNDYGDYSQLLIVVSIATIVSGFGLTNAVNYFYNKYDDDDEKKYYFNLIFTITFISGMLCAFLCYIFRDLIASYYKNPGISVLFIYIIFKPLFDNIVALYQPLYISLHKSKTIAVRNLIISILKTIFVPLAFVVTKSIKWMFIVQIILDVLQIVYFTLDLKKNNFKVRIVSIKKSAFVSIMKYSIPLAIALMLGNLFKESDKLVIARLMDKEALAIYSNMSKQLPFEFIAMSFASVVTPLIVKTIKKDKNEAAIIWTNYLKFCYITSWILCGGAILCSRELLLFLYSDKYILGLEIFNIYLIAELLRFTYFGLIPTACGKTKVILISSFSALIVNLILNVLFYYVFGFIGPALASLFSSFVIYFLQFIFSCKELDRKLFEILDLKHILKFLTQLLFIGLLLFILKQFVSNFITHYFVILVVFYLFYVLINLFLVRKNLLDLVKKIK